VISYETAKLAELDDSYCYGVDCSSCCRTKRLSLVRLRAALRDGFPLVEMHKRLKCSTCNNRQVTVMFLAPNQAGTSLQHLFQLERCNIRTRQQGVRQ
jgi:hypothetical protein